MEKVIKFQTASQGDIREGADMNWSKTAIAITITLCIAFSSVPSFGAEKKPESSDFEKRYGKPFEADDLKGLIKKAKAGDAKAQFNLGWMYSKGQGVQPNREKAIEWYRMAAKQGHVAAQHNLDLISASDKREKQDDEEAVKWMIRKAAEQGIVEAQIGLGMMYEKGLGVRQDYEEAVKWWRKAPSRGMPWANPCSV